MGLGNGGGGGRIENQNTQGERVLPLFSDVSPAGKSPDGVQSSETTFNPGACREELVRAHEKALCEASECWETDRDRYWECLHDMQVAYNLLVLLSEDTKEEVATMRVNVAKEVLRVEREMQRVDDRLAMTRGNPVALVEEAYTLGCQHLRLCDQLDTVQKALR